MEYNVRYMGLVESYITPCKDEEATNSFIRGLIAHLFEGRDYRDELYFEVEPRYNFEEREASRRRGEKPIKCVTVNRKTLKIKTKWRAFL